MTAAEFNSRFDLICDKVGSPYFSPSEKESFINTAQYSIIDELMFPKRRNQEKKDQDVFGFQYQNSMLQGLQKLRGAPTITPASANQITFAEIFGQSSFRPYRVINVSLPNTNPVTERYNARYVPSLQSTNSIMANLQIGKNTSVRYATYSVRNDIIFLSVTLTELQRIGGTIVEFIRVPNDFSISGNVTCEVDPIYHNEILFRALQLAGIAIRENDFYQAVSVEQQKES